MYIVDKIVYMNTLHTFIYINIHTYGLFHYELRVAQVPKVRTEGLVEHLVLHSPNPGTAGMYLYIFYVCMCVCMYYKCIYISSLYMYV